MKTWLTRSRTHRYVCETNYEPNGNATCLNGQWLNDTRRAALPCRDNPVGIENMNFSSTDCALTESGESCAVGVTRDIYRLVLPDCSLAQWDVSSTYCEEKPCSSFRYRISRLQCHIQSQWIAMHQRECRTCLWIRLCSGYGASTANSTCSLGKWSNASCTPFPCPEDPVVANLDHNGKVPKTHLQDHPH